MSDQNSKLAMRSSQLITPFGVGALIEIDGQSFLIKGTRYWSEKFITDKGDYKNLVNIDFPQLTNRLRGISQLKKAVFEVPIMRFPSWHFCPSCRIMTKLDFSWDKAKEESNKSAFSKPICTNKQCKGKELVPMRFVAVCQHGHISDIDWIKWAHRNKQGQGGKCDFKQPLKFIVSGQSGGDFNNMHIVCKCSENDKLTSHNSLEGINTYLGQFCDGFIPGEPNAERQECKDKNGKQTLMEMQPRGASSLHYPSILSALDISINDQQEETEEDIIKDNKFLTTIEFMSGLPKNQRQLGSRMAVQELAEKYGLDEDKVFELLTYYLEGGDLNENLEVEDAEITQYEILDIEFPVLSKNISIKSKHLITNPHLLDINSSLKPCLKKIVQVERLREVRVFRGFQRIQFGSNNTIVKPYFNAEGIKWLPASEVFGEGIFLEFDETKLHEWYNKFCKIINNITYHQITTAQEQGLLNNSGITPSPYFIMLHTFSHILINQLSFDSGYSSTSLKERIYSNLDKKRYGILIYTTDADAEGSMGGLVEMGTPKYIEEVIYKAVTKSTWCSSDPVCRELEKQGVGGLNAAACHACSLISETSCSYMNVLLNRLLVSSDGRLNGKGKAEPEGFFNNYIKKG